MPIKLVAGVVPAFPETYHAGGGIAGGDDGIHAEPEYAKTCPTVGTIAANGILRIAVTVLAKVVPFTSPDKKLVGADIVKLGKAPVTDAPSALAIFTDGVLTVKLLPTVVTVDAFVPTIVGVIPAGALTVKFGKAPVTLAEPALAILTVGVFTV